MKWILGTLALLAAGLALQLSLLVYAMYVLLGVLLLSYFFSQSWITGLTATRYCAANVLEIGQTADVRVEVENKSPFAIPWLILEDSLPRDALVQRPPRLQSDGLRLLLTRMEAGQTEVITYQMTFLLRGYYQIGPLLLETGDVFGLHRRFRVAAEPHYVLVLPRVVPLDGYNLASRRPIGEIRLAHRLFEDPTRLASIRPYQPGDPLNRVHWRATARTGQLHSRVYESSQVAGATFLLDFHAGSYEGAGASASAELAVTTVASLANAVYLMGQQIGFVTNGRDAADRIRADGWRADFTTRADAQIRAAQPLANERLRPIVVSGGKGETHFGQILETLARLEHTDGLDFSQMIGEAASEIRRDATVIPVLRQVTPDIVIALGALVRRGFAVTAVVIRFNETETPDWAHPPEWADRLLAAGVDFRLVNSEQALSQLCAEAIVR